MDADSGAAQLSGHFYCRLHVGDVGVDAAVGEQAKDVDCGPLLFGGRHGLAVGRILEEAPVLDGLGNPGQVLKDHPSCADVGMSHFAVAHLSHRQAHIQTGGGKPAGGMFGKQLIQDGSGRGLHRVALHLVPQAEAVHNNQSCRCFHVTVTLSVTSPLTPDWPR